MDRRPSQGIRRTLLPATLHAAAGEEHLEPDQSRARCTAVSGWAYDAARPEGDRRRESGWTLDRRLRADPPLERGAASRRSARRDQGEPACGEDLRHAHADEPVRA